MMRSMTTRSISAIFSLFVILIFVLSLPGIADARGGGRGGGGGGRGGGGFSRGGGGGGGGVSRSAGGFSRSSVASGGSFSSRSVSRPQAASRPAGIQQRPGAAAGARPAPSGQREQLATRQRPAPPAAGQPGTGERQQQRQESAGGRQEGRQQSQEERQQSRTESREDWQSHMREQQEERQDWIEDEDWDDHWHHDDWDEGEAFVAGAFIGTTMGMAAAAAATPTYVTTLPCATTAVIANGASYYNCGGTWYSRGYSSGTVVYIVTGPP